MGYGFIEIQVDGSHREAGELIGEAARELIRESIQYYEEHHETMAGMSFQEAEREAMGYLTHARRWVPEIVEELEGMAAGSGVPMSKLLVPNCGEELTCSGVGELLDVTSTAGHCTSFALVADDHVLMGHNEDWYSGDTPRNVLLRMRLEDGTRIVSITPACLLASSGISSRGFATSANTLFANDVKTGVPNNFIRRWMLEAPTLEEARARACLPARARGSNHVLADRHGRIWDVETSATAAVTLESGSMMVHTNHYLHNSMLAYEMEIALESSRARFERARELLTAGIESGEDPRRLAGSILADHANEGSEICNHEDEGLPEGERQSTTASMVWDLDAMTADVCAGPPCENPRRVITLS